MWVKSLMGSDLALEKGPRVWTAVCEGCKRFMTQPEGHMPVAWVPVLIKQADPVSSEFVISGQKKQTRTNFLGLQDVGVVDTCSPTLLLDPGNPRCEPGKAAAKQR